MEEILFTKKGKPRKRRPKKKIDYFTHTTQEAILRYRACEDELERNKIYNQEIHRSLYKLAENIIHTFKFYHTEVDNIEDLKYEVISFLLQKLHLYDDSKGKAYSYLGTIAKRYLIAYCQKNYNKLVEKKSIKNVDNDERTIDSLIIRPESGELNRLHVIDELVQYFELNMFNIFETEDEIKAADSLIEILKRAENLDISNKKVLFVYVKEMCDVKSGTITKVINRMKIVYKEILERKIEKEDY
jgi:DNA-directed RNA polymerase specialized sigma24 family protein